METRGRDGARRARPGRSAASTGPAGYPEGTNGGAPANPVRMSGQRGIVLFRRDEFNRTREHAGAISRCYKQWHTGAGLEGTAHHRTTAASCSSGRGGKDPACCFLNSPVGSPRELTALFRRRIGWDDGAVRDAARALRAVWTRPWTTHPRCPTSSTLSRLSPTSSTGPTTSGPEKRAQSFSVPRRRSPATGTIIPRASHHSPGTPCSGPRTVQTTRTTSP